MKAFLRRYWLALAIPLAFVALWVVLWAVPPTNLALRTLLLYPQLFVSLPDMPLNLLGDEPIVETVDIPAPGGEPIEADVYRPPGGGRYGAVLIVMGAAPAARHDPRAVRLAEGVARMGYVVMLPVLPRLSQDVLTPDDTEAVIASFRYLQGHPFVEPRRIAVLGFSVGQGLAFAAAADPRIRDDVRLLASFGGYYDMKDVITAVTSRTIDVDGQRRPWRPDPRSDEVLRDSLLHFVPDEDEQRLLVAALDGDLSGAASPSAIDGLSPTARSVYAILSNEDPLRARQLLAQVPPSQAQALRRLSPRTYLADLRAEVFIVADRNDRLLPFTQSRLLHDSLLGHGLQVHYAEVSIFHHVDPVVTANPLGFLADFAKVFFQSYTLFRRLQ